MASRLKLPVLSSGRTLLSHRRSAGEAPHADGDYADPSEDMFFLPTIGTEGRVIRGTRCGSMGSSCGNGTAHPPDASRIGLRINGTIAFKPPACVLLVYATRASGLRFTRVASKCSLPSNCASRPQATCKLSNV